MQHQGIFKKKSLRKVCAYEFSAPEIKIFLILCYLLAFMVTIWTTQSIAAGNVDDFKYHLTRYITCMAQGIRENEDCQSYKKEVENLSLPELHVIYTVLFAFLNFSSLPLVVQFRTVKDSVRQAARRMSRRSTTSS